MCRALEPRKEADSLQVMQVEWSFCMKWLFWWALPQNTPLRKYTTPNRVSIRGSRDKNLSKR